MTRVKPRSPKDLDPSQKESIDEVKRRLDNSPEQGGSGLGGSLSIYNNPKTLKLENQYIKKHPDCPSGIALINDARYRDKSGLPAPSVLMYNISEKTDTNETIDLRNRETLAFASRFEVSSMTDIKTPSIPGDFKARSAIIARADVIDLKGSEFVQIQTGGRRYNSRGARIDVLGGVHIVAGEADRFPVQPLVKGYNLKDFLDDVMKNIGDLASTMQKMHTEIMILKASLALHFHIGATGPVAPSLDLCAGIISMVAGDFTTTANLMGMIANIELTKVNYLMPFAKKWILSRYNKAN